MWKETKKNLKAIFIQGWTAVSSVMALKKLFQNFKDNSFAFFLPSGISHFMGELEFILKKCEMHFNK